jgi:hypothetical protein
MLACVFREAIITLLGAYGIFCAASASRIQNNRA